METTHGIDSIVLVEDNPDDAFFVKHSLEQARIVNPLEVFESVDRLRRRLSTTEASTRAPVLFVVDMHLVGSETGVDFLRWLREQPEPLGSTPAMMLAGSDPSTARDESSRLGSTLYLQKPVTAETLTNAVQALGYVIVTTLESDRMGSRIIERR